MARTYAARGKFKPQHTRIDGILFDSSFEASVYKRLRAISECDLEVQHPVLLKPETAHFKAQYWACDFNAQILFDNKQHPILFEAKGLITSEFKRICAQLEYYCPTYYGWIVVVFPDHYSTSDRMFKEVEKAEAMGLKYCFLGDIEDTFWSHFQSA